MNLHFCCSWLFLAFFDGEFGFFSWKVSGNPGPYIIYSLRSSIHGKTLPFAMKRIISGLLFLSIHRPPNSYWSIVFRLGLTIGLRFVFMHVLWFCCCRLLSYVLKALLEGSITTHEAHRDSNLICVCFSFFLK